MTDSTTCFEEGKRPFNRKDDYDESDEHDMSKKVVFKFGAFPPKVAVNYVLPMRFWPKDGQPAVLDDDLE